MNESPESESLSPLAQLFTPAEADALSELMLSFDGGMLDFGELDGFLSALAVAPQPQTIERWWTALVGPEPEWEAEDEPARARALIERYYAMVQARVAASPFDLGPESMPPLWSMTDAEEGEYDDDELDFDDNDLDDSDLDDLDSDETDVADEDDDEALADLESVRAQLRAAIETEPDLDESIEADDADFDDDEFDDDQFDELAEEDPEFLDDDMDVSFAVGETWLSGFRYALSLQADDWRKVIEAEPPLASWLDALWRAADSVQGEGGSIGVLPAMAPEAAAPEDAGFLALEAALRQSSERQEALRLDEDQLLNLLPLILHQLWRRHRDGAESVSDALQEDTQLALLNSEYQLRDELEELLKVHAVPAGGMTLEQLDGMWTAQRAAGLEVSPFDHLERICGKDKVWDSADEASELMQALLAYWQQIGERLQREPNPDYPGCFPHIEMPAEFDEAHPPKTAIGRDFALSFLAAIEDFPRSAKLLLMDPEAKHWLAPFEAIAEGKSLEKRGARLDFEERMGLIAELPECIAGLGSFWNAAGGVRPQPPARAESLPGRNDPCPCGSGKKYKKCHGAPERLN
ncbi:MAG: UPF0149 family protein [Lysobacterales bacterium]